MDGVSVIIVCGGRSTRLGRDKKFATLNGSTFLDHALETARAVSDDVILVVGSRDQVHSTEAASGLPVYVDEVEGFGPLMGILTGLVHTKGEYGAVMPVDTPFLKPDVMKHLISLRLDYDGVVPEDRGHLEPLHGVYRKNAMIRACRAVLERGEKGVNIAVRSLGRLRLVPVKELRSLDPGLLSFKSINTPDDYEAVMEGRG